MFILWIMKVFNEDKPHRYWLIANFNHLDTALGFSFEPNLKNQQKIKRKTSIKLMTEKMAGKFFVGQLHASSNIMAIWCHSF